MAEDPELWRAIDRLTHIVAQQYERQYTPLGFGLWGTKKCDDTYSVEGSKAFSEYEKEQTEFKALLDKFTQRIRKVSLD